MGLFVCKYLTKLMPYDALLRSIKYSIRVLIWTWMFVLLLGPHSTALAPDEPGMDPEVDFAVDAASGNRTETQPLGH